MKAWELLNEESKWTTKAFARTEQGDICGSADEHAACWCVLGAMLKCYDYKYRQEVFDKLQSHLSTNNIIRWNDINKYSTVIETLKELDI